MLTMYGQLSFQKITILRPLQFGDLLCTIPALRALRAAYPNASISLIGLPWAKKFVSRFENYLDELIEFPGFPGFPERNPDILAFPDFLKLVQDSQFDLALQFHGSGALSNSITALLGAKMTAGFALEGLYRPDEFTYIEYPVEEHEIWRHLRLLQHLGIPLHGDHLEYPLRPEDWEAYRDLEGQFGLDRDEVIVIHTGSRAPGRRWSADKFATVADEMIAKGYRVVLTGTDEEREVTQSVLAQMSHRPVDLTGRTTDGSLGALIANARLVICNDTAVSHLAAALRTPSVVLFMTSEPERWAPLDRALHHPILWASAAIPAVVLRESDLLLQKERSYAIQ